MNSPIPKEPSDVPDRIEHLENHLDAAHYWRGDMGKIPEDVQGIIERIRAALAAPEAQVAALSALLATAVDDYAVSIGKPKNSPNHWVTKATALLSASPPSGTVDAVREGWQWVPKEATPEMANAARTFLEPCTVRIGQLAWRAMLAVAPSKPPTVQVALDVAQSAVAREMADEARKEETT